MDSLEDASGLRQALVTHVAAASDALALHNSSSPRDCPMRRNTSNSKGRPTSKRHKSGDFGSASAPPLTGNVMGRQQEALLALPALSAPLYDPETPWGLKGIDYDPASPLWSWSLAFATVTAEPTTEAVITSSAKPAALTGSPTTPTGAPRPRQNVLSHKRKTSASTMLPLLRMNGHGLFPPYECSLASVADVLNRPLLPLSLPLSSTLTETAVSIKAEANQTWRPGLPVRTATKAPDVVPVSVPKGDGNYLLEGKSSPNNGPGLNKSKARAKLAKGKGKANANGLPSPKTPLNTRQRGRPPKRQVKDAGAGDVAQTSPPRCCPVEVPAVLHMILDETGEGLEPRMVELFTTHKGDLCPEHLDRFVRLTAKMEKERMASAAHFPTTPFPAPTPLPIGSLNRVTPVPAPILPAASPSRVTPIRPPETPPYPPVTPTSPAYLANRPALTESEEAAKLLHAFMAPIPLKQCEPPVQSFSDNHLSRPALPSSALPQSCPPCQPCTHQDQPLQPPPLQQWHHDQQQNVFSQTWPPPLTYRPSEGAMEQYQQPEERPQFKHQSHLQHQIQPSEPAIIQPIYYGRDNMASFAQHMAPQSQPETQLQPQPPTKKKKLSVSGRTPRTPRAVGRNGIRPVINVVRDNKYRLQMLKEIETLFCDSETTHGGVTNRIVYNLLMVAHSPRWSMEKKASGGGSGGEKEEDVVDVHLLTGEEARVMLDKGTPNEPIVTDKEQTFKWQPHSRPIAELFRRMENLDRRVSVQVPSRSCMGDSFESRELTEVRDRFLTAVPTTADAKGGSTNDGSTDDPWNVLDLRSPLPAAVLPQFLTSENCQLLPRLRDEVLNPSRAERDTATREQWNEWRDVLEWVLLSQGGHNTSPHTDSHGLGTWITVQEGLFGYGWMSHPTAEERAAWTQDPHNFTGGRWCYVILEPGQTVFFNSGTVHFVFRLRSAATLALGGHVLQWTGIERWLEIVAAQMQNPHITNEDMEWSAPKYVRVVARLVESRLRNGRVEEMGGEDAVRQLLAMLKDFDENYIKGRPPKAKAKKKKHR